ncbi:SMI1/KNR4 family protein [Oribacterium sp. WCC10]|uniref:SMI1/KNR4 family protein n=1 Tax=Oribacterium sp. WCC10 TaxID=1855343 RepID=UPI0008F126B4|nr:SMI1/KNR4 family protein [Oribacterium sp. WCC10]SFG56260.1 SMI1 / KNR4 family (SUKH-1) [Oribacterium sp. WCC10]
MKCISEKRKLNINKKIFEDAEKTYSITIRSDIKDFLGKNSGGYPTKDIIISDGEEYEVRVFMSLDESDKNYYILKPMDYFLKKTKGKIIPIGIDSGDNYYCVNNETGKVYYWSAGEDTYYCISETLDRFISLFE